MQNENCSTLNSFIILLVELKYRSENLEKKRRKKKSAFHMRNSLFRTDFEVFTFYIQSSSIQYSLSLCWCYLYIMKTLPRARDLNCLHIRQPNKKKRRRRKLMYKLRRNVPENQPNKCIKLNSINKYWTYFFVCLRLDFFGLQNFVANNFILFYFDSI